MNDLTGRVRVQTRFSVAWQGVVRVFRTEWSFRCQCVIFAVVVVLGFLLRLSVGEWLAVVLCSGAVFAAEMFNTALEYLADTVHPERDPGIGRAKDASAGGVLVAAVAAALVGAIVFVPKLWLLLKTLLAKP